MVPRKQKHSKKKRRWLYIVIPILLLILGFAGYVVYELKIKQYDVADPVIDGIIEESFVINFPDGEKIIFDKDGEILTGTAGPTSGNSYTDIDTSKDNPKPINNNVSQNSTNGSSTSYIQNNKNTATKPNNTKPSVDSIKAKYIPTLKALETQANEKINGLVEQAKQEYISKKSSGEGISYGYFYNKYYGAAERLESRMDVAFNSILTIIEKELEDNGYSKEHAQTFRDDYNATKETRKSHLINKALELF